MPRSSPAPRSRPRWTASSWTWRALTSSWRSRRRASPRPAASWSGSWPRTASCWCIPSRSRSGSSASMPTARSCGAGAPRSAASPSTCSTSSCPSRGLVTHPNFRIEIALTCEEEIRGPIPDERQVPLSTGLVAPGSPPARRRRDAAHRHAGRPAGPAPGRSARAVHHRRHRRRDRTLEAARDARRLLPRSIRRDRAARSPRSARDLRPVAADRGRGGLTRPDPWHVGGEALVPLPVSWSPDPVDSCSGPRLRWGRDDDRRADLGRPRIWRVRSWHSGLPGRRLVKGSVAVDDG